MGSDPINGHMSSTTRRIVTSALTIDWTQVEWLAALRCTVGVAVPLLLAIAFDQPTVGVFGAVGAVSVGFGSFQGAYRSRAVVMLMGACGMALSIFLGSLAGHSTISAAAVALLWGFASGLLVAIGPAASFVGLQSAVGALVAGGFPSDVPQALARMLLVLGGGAFQTLLVVSLWPLRRFPAERAMVARVYRSLGDYAASLPSADSAPPEPHTQAGLTPPHADPQPFARVSEMAVFQALLDEGERLRTSLGAVASLYTRAAVANDGPTVGTVSQVATIVARLLRAVADAADAARPPEAPEDLWRELDAACRALPAERSLLEALAGQLRASWRLVSAPTSAEESSAAHDPRVRPTASQLPRIRDTLATLRANLTPQSTAFRHALRLAVSLAITTAAYRVTSLERGYWLSLTVLLVLKPEFTTTFTRGVARVIGTIVGAGFATLITVIVHPGPTLLTAFVLAFVWLGYALFRTNYALFTVCITGYVVFLVSMAGIPEIDAATYRALDTLIGGLFALAVYAVWPTWEGRHVRELLATMFEAQSRYLCALLGVYAQPEAADLRRLHGLRAAARLARSNAEASVDRLLAEPAGGQEIDPKIAAGVVASVRRSALASLALLSGVERGPRRAVPGVAALAEQVREALRALATAMRTGGAVVLPPLRQTQLAIDATVDPLVGRETDVLVDALNSIAALMGSMGSDPANPDR